MISILVPIYNVENYISNCLDSLINQTQRDIEIILVDDGSPDKCPEICDEYANKDARVCVIHKKNGGESSARNVGLRVANRKYIGFVDPDDWISYEMYEKMQVALMNYQADLVVCGYEYCHDDGTVDERRRYIKRNKEILSQKEMMRRCSDIPPTIRHVVWNKLFRKELIKDLTFQESLCASMDVKFLTEYLQKTQKAIFLHEPYYYNRVRPGSATHGGLSVRSLAETYAAHEYMYKTVVELYPELKDYSQAFLLDVYLLKYNQAKEKTKISKSVESDRRDLEEMRKKIHTEGKKAIFNNQIYWKTRLAYLFVK